MPRRSLILSILPALVLASFAAQAGAQTYLDFENQVQEFTLDNGVRFLVLENHDVPVFSFRTFVNVGSADESRGITGLSHILEHMAFKGTAEIGTTDYKAELKAMQKEDEAFAALKEVRRSIEPVLAEYEQHVAAIPADRLENFQAIEAALKDLPSQATVAAPGGGAVDAALFAGGGLAKAAVTRAAGTERQAVEEFEVGEQEYAALAFYLDRVKAAREDLLAKEAAFTAAKDAARAFVVTNEYGQIVENNGGQGLNAYTNTDVTVYHYNLPSNRLELWAYLEGSRMAGPVLREFYTEKDGPVTEERRMRTDNNPIGRMIEQFQNLMFMANGYHHSTIGYMSDLNTISRDDCQTYFQKNYVGSNIVVSIVGDVKVDEVKKLARKYFSAIPAGSPEAAETAEPAQLGEKRFVMEDPSQPLYAAGYHIESVRHPDWPVYEVIADVLGQGRTSRLYKSLVKEQQLAVQAVAFPGFPGQKHQTGLIVFAVPVKGKTALDMEAAVDAQIDAIVQEGITDQELQAVKQRARANFVRGLQGNGGMASQLAWYQTYLGDWRRLFDQVAEIEAVTRQDVSRVAKDIFQTKNRTVAIIETQEQES